MNTVHWFLFIQLSLNCDRRYLILQTLVEVCSPLVALAFLTLFFPFFFLLLVLFVLPLKILFHWVYIFTKLLYFIKDVVLFIWYFVMTLEIIVEKIHQKTKRSQNFLSIAKIRVPASKYWLLERKIIYILHEINNKLVA